jgi:hypothetical protein
VLLGGKPEAGHHFLEAKKLGCLWCQKLIGIHAMEAFDGTTGCIHACVYVNSNVYFEHVLQSV